MRRFLVISKHRMISHYLPKLKISMESLNNEQIWLQEAGLSNSVGGIVLHVLEHLKRNTERLKNRNVQFDKGIEDYFPNAGADKSQIISEIDRVFGHLAEAMDEADPEQIDVHSIYHLVEHTGYHLGQIIDRAQRLSGLRFQFVQNGINEKALRTRIDEEMERSYKVSHQRKGELMMPTEDEELIKVYAETPKKLEEAVARLSESDLDKVRAKGKWSIREITHHIVECDLHYFQFNRFALADTGVTYRFNEFDSNIWNKKLENDRRPVEPELQLFKMIHEYFVYLCNALPNSLDRVIVHEEGRATVREALKHDIGHAEHHIEQILETRRVHRI